MLGGSGAWLALKTDLLWSFWAEEWKIDQEDAGCDSAVWIAFWVAIIKGISANSYTFVQQYAA